MIITKRDKETAAETGTRSRPPLEICPKCGWYEHEILRSECDPKRGEAASRLIAALPEIRSGKLGFGFGRVVFEIDDNTHVVFEVLVDGFSIETGGVWCLHTFRHEDAKKLVLAIADIVKGLDTKEKRRGL